MKIKVSGLRDGENIREVAALGVDWIGMVFREGSPRNVTMIPTHAGIIPDRAPAAPSPLPAGRPAPQRVGVFTDEMAQNIITRVVNFRLNAVQLDGDETPTLIRNLRATLTNPSPGNGQAIAPGLQVWKTIAVGTAADLARCRDYEDCCDAFVFTTPDSGDRHSDWSVLDGYCGPLPFLLSGGLYPGDTEALHAFRHPRLAGIDLTTHFETAPAMMDITRLSTFLSALRH